MMSVADRIYDSIIYDCWYSFVVCVCATSLLQRRRRYTNKKTNGGGLTVPLRYEWARSLLHQIVVKEVVEGMIGTIFHGDNGPIEESVFLWKRRRRGLINFLDILVIFIVIIPS